ncbi:MAG: SUMF1/EgtB/PvdO family nonheme iron enzyme [Candidatus Promineifilaceae bacterium]
MARLRYKNKWLIFILAAALILMVVSAAAAQDSSPSTDDSDEAVEMVSISGTTFEMGESAEVMLDECDLFRTGCELSWFSASQPIHTVELDPFSIDLYEVTNKAFLEFINELDSIQGGCDGEDCVGLDDSQIRLDGADLYTVDEELMDHPVAGVTWYGANAFCEWRDARLPTEAEWELAAGWNFDSAEKHHYPWGDEFDGNITNFCDVNCKEQQANPDYDDGYATTAPVGSYEDGRSSAGLYDVAGNLWEWVSDWYDTEYYENSPGVNPTGPATGDNKVVRGGSWFDTGNFTSTIVRFPAPPEESGDSIGFRCASDTIDEDALIGTGIETAEVTIEPEETAEPEETVEATATATKVPTATATKTPTVEPTTKPTEEPTATATKVPTATATATVEPTATKEPEPTAMSEPTATATVKAASTAEAGDKEEGTFTVSSAYLDCEMYPGVDRGDTYVVGACDFMTKIAYKLGVSYWALLAVNPQIEDPNVIYKGQILNVPLRDGQIPMIPTATPLPAAAEPLPSPDAEIVVPQPTAIPPATPHGSSLRG